MTTTDQTIVQLSDDILIDLGERVLSVQPATAQLAPFTPGGLQALRASAPDSMEHQAFLSALRAWLAANLDAVQQLYPEAPPPFDHLQSYWTNFYNGPSSSRPPTIGYRGRPTFSFLGFDVGIPFGVPACAVTPHSGYVEYFASRGFDLITYKTVRGGPWNPYPSPNLAFAAGVRTPITPDRLDEPVVPTMFPDELPGIAEASFVNSIGVPSLPVEQWQADIERSKRVLREGQVLIVSVMGSPETLRSNDDAGLVRQFTDVATQAQEAGANIVELNLSCPNTGGILTCLDAELSGKITAAVREAIGDTPLLLKISYMAEQNLAALVRECRPNMSGIVAINAVQVRAQNANATGFFKSRNHDHAGLSGAGIRSLGLGVTRTLASLREREGASTQDWTIVGIGGVAGAADFQAYLDAGADAVQSCTGSWLNPQLAQEIHDHPLGISSSVGTDIHARSGGTQDSQTGTEHDHQHDWRRWFHAVNDTVRTGGLNLRVEEPRPRKAGERSPQ